MKKELFCRMHNRYHCQLVDARTGEVKQDAWAENVVTDLYYDAWLNYNRSATGAHALKYICVGTGTGTPSASDRNLFQQLATSEFTSGNYKKLGSDSYSYMCSTTFTENQAIGLLTEVGLKSNQSSWLMSHAMLTDGEGHTITIDKTANDRLTITCTLYLTFTFPAGIDPPGFYDTQYIRLNLHARYETEPEEVVPSSAPQWLRYLFAISGWTGELSLILAPQAVSAGISLSGSLERISSGGIRVYANTVPSTDKNKSTTYQILGIDTIFGQIPLPNHDIFEPVELTLEATAASNQTDFNFGIPFLMPSPVSVYVDNVLQNASDYDWGGTDFEVNRQSWISQSGKYLISPVEPVNGAERSRGPLTNQYLSKGAASTSEDTVFVYDFEQPRTMNALRHTCNCGNLSSVSFRHCILEYSTDGTTWTEATRVTTSDSAKVILTSTFAPITARYWRTKFVPPRQGSAQTDVDTFNDPLGAFDNISPQLRLHTAPAAGKVVKVIAKSEYPLKNSNWIIDQLSVDFVFSRGDNS